MPAIIDSAPDCVSNPPATEDVRVEDSADFILQGPYQECLDGTGGFMTFGPGSTYGEGGEGANGAYMAVTWIGIVVTILVLIYWVVSENKRLNNFVNKG